MSINSVILTGRLTRDPELKTTQSNIPVCAFTIAVDKNFKDEGADFISIVAWRSTAENVAKFKRKGDLIGVQGRLSTRQYDTDGGTKYVTEVVADVIKFLEIKKQEEEIPHKNSNIKMNSPLTTQPPMGDDGEDLPF